MMCNTFRDAKTNKHNKTARFIGGYNTDSEEKNKNSISSMKPFWIEKKMTIGGVNYFSILMFVTVVPALLFFIIGMIIGLITDIRSDMLLSYKKKTKHLIHFLNKVCKTNIDSETLLKDIEKDINEDPRKLMSRYRDNNDIKKIIIKNDIIKNKIYTHIYRHIEKEFRNSKYWNTIKRFISYDTIMKKYEKNKVTNTTDLSKLFTKGDKEKLEKIISSSSSSLSSSSSSSSSTKKKESLTKDQQEIIKLVKSDILKKEASVHL